MKKGKRVKKWKVVLGVVLIMMVSAGVALSAYHHEGEDDSPNFLAQYPSKAGTKLDHCALCHTGGSYVNSKGKTVSLGSCQWCHYAYGTDASGNIVDTINPYGMAYLTNGRNQAALVAIEGLDSDGDGYTNITEINADRYPGNASDDPSKVPAPSKIYTMAQLQALGAHTQFLLMNAHRSDDDYSQYTGVPVEDLLEDAGILKSATGITAFAPDGWATYYSLEEDSDPEIYHVKGTYPESVYYYDTEADLALNPESGWCDYSAPSCAGRSHLDTITNANGLKMILAYQREGEPLEPGILSEDNKLDGEGPFRVVPPQKDPCPPDQAENAADQDVVWPFDDTWDHNKSYAARTVTMIRVEPLPEGTTDIDVLEAGWQYVDDEKIVVYGAIEDPNPPAPTIKVNGEYGPVTVSSGDNVSVTVELDAGSRIGQMADWWAFMYVPSESYGVNWQSYIFKKKGWVYGVNVCTQVHLFSFKAPFEIMNEALPKGDYVFFFGVDSNADGLPDLNWLDQVKVKVE
jgi:hypothetical protein